MRCQQRNYIHTALCLYPSPPSYANRFETKAHRSIWCSKVVVIVGCLFSVLDKKWWTNTQVQQMVMDDSWLMVKTGSFGIQSRVWRHDNGAPPDCFLTLEQDAFRGAFFETVIRHQLSKLLLSSLSALISSNYFNSPLPPARLSLFRNNKSSTTMGTTR